MEFHDLPNGSNGSNDILFKRKLELLKLYDWKSNSVEFSNACIEVKIKEDNYVIFRNNLKYYIKMMPEMENYTIHCKNLRSYDIDDVYEWYESKCKDIKKITFIRPKQLFDNSDDDIRAIYDYVNVVHSYDEHIVEGWIR